MRFFDTFFRLRRYVFSATRPRHGHTKNRFAIFFVASFFSPRGQRTHVANRPRGRRLDVSRNIIFWGLLHIFLLLFRNKFFSSTLLVPGCCCFRQWLAPGAQADAVLDNGLLRVRKPMLLPAGAEL